MIGIEEQESHYPDPQPNPIIPSTTMIKRRPAFLEPTRYSWWASRWQGPTWRPTIEDKPLLSTLRIKTNEFLVPKWQKFRSLFVKQSTISASNQPKNN